MYSTQFLITLIFILCVFSSSPNTITYAQQENQPTSTTAMTNTATGTTQSINGTPLPNATSNNTNNNNSSAAAGPTNAQSGHGAMMTPSQAAAPHSSLSPSTSGGMSNTTRPPQVAPFPDDTVGKNGRLRVSSTAAILTTPDSSSYSFIISLFLFPLFLSLIQ